LQEIVDIAGAIDKPVYLWHREIMMPQGMLTDRPALLDKDGEFDLLGRDFEEFLRYKLDNLFRVIPGIGGAVGDTVRTLAGSVSYIKNVVGVGGIALIVVLTLPTLISLLLSRLVLLVTSTVAGMLGCSREGRLLSELGNIYGFDGGNYAGNVYDKHALAPTMLNMQGGNRQPMIIENETVQIKHTIIDRCRLRRLTPKECWRLMGFDDADFEKAAQVNSNAQLYKQAGNSIVVNVLEAIFKELFKGETSTNIS
jgi:hypothetical protein